MVGRWALSDGRLEKIGLRIRTALMVCLVLSFTFLLSLVSAQDEPPPSSLDALPPGATPAPLPTRMAQPAPSLRIRGERAHLLLYFQNMAQGTTGLLKIEGEAIASVRARWIDQLFDFYPTPDGFYGLISVSMEQTPNAYPLDVFVNYADGSRKPINADIDVVLVSFIQQDVTIAPEKAYLLQPDVERNQLARLESISANVTPERRWDETGFQMA